MIDFLVRTFRELKADRLRTLLSLLGVAVGIFSIVASLTLVDSLRNAVSEGFEAFGSDLLFVEREPLEPDLNEDGVFRWWAFTGRPQVSWNEYRYLKDRGSGSSGMQAAFSRIAFASHGRRCVGVDGDWPLVVGQPLAEGRGFSAGELSGGRQVAVVGADVEAAVGSSLWIDGTRYTVIGRFARAGATTVSTVDVDRARIVPFRAMHSPSFRNSIVLSDADDGRVRTLMREVRRLPPTVPDNFAFNRLSFLLDEMGEIFRLVARLGWIVGVFSLLVGGFGIANMLYVSVEERKPYIGLCRALGARRRTIVAEFLCEAVVLSLLGAAGGIGLVGAALGLVSLAGTSLSLTLSFRAVVSGLAAAAALGLLFGVAPARSAAGLSPVEALGAGL
ncbi:MAG: ABC transporter permease [Bacteroidales bacterium]|nr:ABC transporter permease [Bacteroidales bacterium]